MHRQRAGAMSGLVSGQVAGAAGTGAGAEGMVTFCWAAATSSSGAGAAGWAGGRRRFMLTGGGLVNEPLRAGLLPRQGEAAVGGGGIIM